MKCWSICRWRSGLSSSDDPPCEPLRIIDPGSRHGTSCPIAYLRSFCFMYSNEESRHTSSMSASDALMSRNAATFATAPCRSRFIDLNETISTFGRWRSAQ